MIPHSRPVFGTAFADAARRVVESGQLASGPECLALETEAAGYIGIKYATAVDSGSSALLLALHALNIDGNIRRIGIPAYACRAILHAVRIAGMNPVCMDCDDDLRLDAAYAREIADGLDALILVHPFGMIEPMVEEPWPCPIIEDIAQSAGGQIGDQMLGSFGDACITSFYATKPWGGAYGGMVLSRKTNICARVDQMRCADTADITLPYAGNHQLSDIHAALARVRISKAAEEREQRIRLAKIYDTWFCRLKARPVMCENTCNHYRYITRVADASRTIKSLHAHGVAAARPVNTPISRLAGQYCPGAEAAWKQCVSLPLLIDMSRDELACMEQAVTACM